MSNNIIYQASGATIKKGKIDKKNYESTSDTMYRIASCSKFITSLVVAKLYEMNKLDYDTDINTYLTTWRCPKDGITLRHLLTHTSGSDDGNGFLGMEPQILYTQNIKLSTDIVIGKSYSKPYLRCLDFPKNLIYHF